ncbi:MAG: hypothetical protein Q9217_005858 [Psora testacea]
MATIMSYLRIPFLAFSGLTTLASGLLYFKQNELIYPRYLPAGARTEEGVPRPNQFGISDYEDIRLITPDGESLSAFLIKPANKGLAKNVTVLMFHGNAGNIGHRVPIAKVIEENSGCNVFMLEYRGYGLSSGTPDEAGIMIDAQTAIDYVRQHNVTKGNKIVVYGQSLGGAVAVQLVAKNQEAGDVKGLILENTFTSMRKLIPSEDVLPQIRKVPILLLSGLKDEIIPSPDVTWRELPNGTHNESVVEPDYFNYIIDFINKKAIER